MYVFKYRNKITNEIIGYHLSTFCQVGEKEKAKRYECSNGWENQRDIILKNVKSIIGGYKAKREHPIAQMFRDIADSVYEEHFKGISEEDIDVESEYLTDGITRDDLGYKITAIDPENGTITTATVQDQEGLAEFIVNGIKEKIAQKLN